MEAELREKIEQAVVKILRSVDMASVTEYKVRKMASEKLGVDLSEPQRKKFVREVVESFLNNLQNPEPEEQQKEEIEEEEEPEEEEDDPSKKSGAKEYDDDGDLIICRLSDRRRVTLQDFRGRTLVSIREYYRKDGRELPSSKGISLTTDQWSAFKKNLPAIEEAIRKMEERVM